MALEISEIGVRMSVGDGKPTGAAATTPNPEEPAATPIAAERESIVQACVRRVRPALRNSEAR
jgi:hypothetical protein